MAGLKRRSSVWNYFKEISPGRARCLLCKKVYSHGLVSTSNLSRHLKMKHVGLFQTEISKKNTPSESASSLDTLALAVQRSGVDGLGRSPVAQVKVESIDVAMPSTSSTAQKHHQHQLGNFMQRPVAITDSEKLDRLLLKFIVKQFHPFRIVEQPEFREFVQELNPGYSLPSRKTCANTLLDQVYNNAVEKLEHELRSVDACCITVDGWTSETNDSYFGITVHYLNEECQFGSAFLDCFLYDDRHTADDISSEIEGICAKWKIYEKVVALISDNTANVALAAKQLGWNHITCFAHTLNLIVQKALNEVEDIQLETKSVVDYFKRNPHATSELKIMQKQMGLPEISLKQEVQTRWNSTLLMFETVLKNKEAILSTLALQKPEIMLTEHQFNVMTKVCELLQPFWEITNEMSSEKEVIISKLILFTRGLFNFFSRYNESKDEREVKCFVQKIRDELKRRFTDIEERSLLAEATILDPRFKKQGFENYKSLEKAKESICEKAGQVTVDDENLGENDTDETEEMNEQQSLFEKRSSIWDHFDGATSQLPGNTSTSAVATIELDKYIQEPLLPRKQDPFRWWHDRKVYYPRLYQIMKKRLCIVGSSAQYENVFSKNGNILVDKRRRLKPNKLSKILFLNYNLE